MWGSCSKKGEAEKPWMTGPAIPLDLHRQLWGYWSKVGDMQIVETQQAGGQTGDALIGDTLVLVGSGSEGSTGFLGLGWNEYLRDSCP